jgi:response regulator RpfG family c-di-GMP phosphodiesterase
MDRQRILIIDDEKDFCALTARNLQKIGNYNVTYALTGQKGIEFARSFKPELILLDINLREVSGLTIIKKIMAINKDMKTIILSGLGTHDNVQEALLFGAADYITKHCEINKLVELIKKHLNLKIKRTNESARSVPKHFMKELFLDALASLVCATESKSKYLKGHSQRVAKIANKIGKEMGLKSPQVKVLKYSAAIHDLGKIGVKDAVLDKKGKLNKAEWENIKKHPVIGSTIISRIRLLRLEEPIVRHHHERFDGKGYPDGLKGADIPLAARIIAIADSYDAMVCNRPYRPKMTHEEALNEIKRCNDTQFDPDVVRTFLKVMPGKRD